MKNKNRAAIFAIAVLAFFAIIGVGMRETEGASMAATPRHGGQIFNGHEYLLVKKELTWQNAKKACEAAGGHLVTITNASENTFVSGVMGGCKNIWIGLTDEAKEGGLEVDHR